ncbi:MAG: class I SAM-dependent methyltransferase [Candidatus Vogelbacteria bacterium]|nr:class I SAM-dependent methyltransferase [Candidatus Vogelbacteria bacterium]
MDNSIVSNWNEKHLKYAKTDWIDKPTLFAEWALQFLPQDGGSMLELGCGQGQDSRFFAEKGFIIDALDFSFEGLNLAQTKTPAELVPKISYEQIDISYPLPFNDDAYDVVYSHLALHYFDERTTHQIFDEIYRVMRTGGVIAIMLNSTSDEEFNAGPKIEKDFFMIDGMEKRYFNIESLTPFVNRFKRIVLDDKGELLKHKIGGERKRGGLIRFVGQKV